MQTWVPIEKQSKKQQRAFAAAKRGTWLGVNPITRKIESKKRYHRKRNPFGKGMPPDQTDFLFFLRQMCRNGLLNRQYFRMKRACRNTQRAMS